jgi:hypothetical protein
VTGVLPALALAAAAGTVGLRTLHSRRNWGATEDESAATLPGDEFVPEPAEQTTLAVAVEASPAEVWAWLVQMGQGRGGMYSYDWLENLIGLDIHTTEEIREEWQHLAVGDRVVVVPEGYGPMPAGYAFRVAAVDPPRALVLRQAPPEHPWNGVWSFHVTPAGDGRCRLLARSRTATQPQLGMRIATRMGEPVTLVMTRRMLAGIKEHAERGRRPVLPGRPGPSSVVGHPADS